MGNMVTDVCMHLLPIVCYSYLGNFQTFSLKIPAENGSYYLSIELEHDKRSTHTSKKRPEVPKQLF